MKIQINSILLTFSLLCAHCVQAQQSSAKAMKATDTQALDKKVTTKLQLFIKSANAPPRPAPGTVVFNKSAGVRITTNANGTNTECPCLEVPLLFVVGTSELLDATSRSNLRLVAADLKTRGQKGQRFSIAGHASAEGDGLFNQQLSMSRSERIRSELIALGVPSEVITNAQGFGSKHATAAADAPEHELQKDRQVLVVKEQ